MLNITCLAHALHRISEKIRDLFPDVDRLIAKTKAVFAKAPFRVKCLREQFPDLPLPPKPVLTRWGTWLSAASYYWEHFESLKKVLSNFDPNDAACIGDSQACFTDSCWQELAYIHSNFGG
uniref:Dimer_Tnp_hAT domain-containing protein n=1 Tax=Meloidogyne hapla TaxID=6305 RepID=A0A1I8B444_MELHA